MKPSRKTRRVKSKRRVRNGLSRKNKSLVKRRCGGTRATEGSNVTNDRAYKYTTDFLYDK